MKRILVVMLVLLLSFGLFARGGGKAFKMNKKLIDVSIGFSRYTTPFAVGYEQPLKDNLGINISALFLSWGYDFGSNNQTLIMPQASLNYHFKMNSPKVDLFAGPGLGFSIYSTDLDNEVKSGGFFLSGMVGIRYYVSKKIAIQARETLVIMGDWNGFYTLIGATFVL